MIVNLLQMIRYSMLTLTALTLSNFFYYQKNTCYILFSAYSKFIHVEIVSRIFNLLLHQWLLKEDLIANACTISCIFVKLQSALQVITIYILKLNQSFIKTITRFH